MPHSRRRTCLAILSLLVPLVWLLPALANAVVVTAPVVTPTDSPSCNGVVPTPGSENTTKRLDPSYPSDFNPGGSVGYIIDFPVDPADVGQTFTITDCVYGDPPGASPDAVIAEYSISFVPNNAGYHLQFAVPIPENTALGTTMCNYAKTTGGPSASPASNRKAGPACFTVGGGLRIEKRAGSAAGALLEGASFTIACTPEAVVPPTLITGLSNPSSTSSGVVSASGTAGDGTVAINGPSGTPCVVTETAAPAGYELDATPRNLVIPVGASQTVNVFVNQLASGSLLVTKSTDVDGTFHFDVDCTGTDYDTTLNITTVGGTGSASLSGIPSGTSCVVSEQDNPLFASSVLPADGTVVITPGDNTVAFTNSRVLGKLEIDKTSDVDGTFDFSVDCDGESYDQAHVPITTVQGSGSATVEGIPSGTVCTVTENHDSTWSVVVTPDDGMATIGSGISKVGFANTKLFSAVTFAKSAVPPSGAAVVAGDSITYTVTYSNSGNVATDVSITDEVPSGTTYVTGSAADGVLAGSTLTWNRSAAADGTGSVSFTVTVNSGLADPTTIHNVALGWVGESSTPTNPTDHPVAHVTIVKAVDRTSAKYGQNLTYTLTVSSPGAADLTDVVVSDPLPVGTSFVSASDSGTCDDPCTRVTWPSVALASDASIERTFVVTIDTPAADAQGGIPAEVITNVGQVETDETGDTPSNEVITDVVTVLGRKIIRKPDDLPFTGAALPLIPAAGMALGVLIAGLALTWAAGPTRRRRNPLA